MRDWNTPALSILKSDNYVIKVLGSFFPPSALSEHARPHRASLAVASRWLCLRCKHLCKHLYAVYIYIYTKQTNSLGRTFSPKYPRHRTNRGGTVSACRTSFYLAWDEISSCRKQGPCACEARAQPRAQPLLWPGAWAWARRACRSAVPTRGSAAAAAASRLRGSLASSSQVAPVGGPAAARACSRPTGRSTRSSCSRGDWSAETSRRCGMACRTLRVGRWPWLQ